MSAFYPLRTSATSIEVSALHPFLPLAECAFDPKLPLGPPDSVVYSATKTELASLGSVWDEPRAWGI